MKLCWAENGLEPTFGIRGVQIVRDGAKYSHDLAFGPTGTVGGGGNSGFQALNLAAQFGSRRIVLIGFDMSDRAGAHWYGRNRWAGSGNIDEAGFRRWIAAMDRAAPLLAARGVDIVNASPSSALTCFRKASIAEALAKWG